MNEQFYFSPNMVFCIMPGFYVESQGQLTHGPESPDRRDIEFRIFGTTKDDFLVEIKRSMGHNFLKFRIFL